METCRLFSGGVLALLWRNIACFSAVEGMILFPRTDFLMIIMLLIRPVALGWKGIGWTLARNTTDYYMTTTVEA